MTQRTIFKKKPDSQKLELLLIFAKLAIEAYEPKYPKRNLWSLAASFGRSAGVKKEDFALIETMTIAEIADTIIQDRILNYNIMKNGKK